MKLFTFRLFNKYNREFNKNVIALDYAQAISELDYTIRVSGAQIIDFNEQLLTHIYTVYIKEIELEYDGHWTFDYDKHFTIYSTRKLSKSELDYKVDDLDLSIQSDTDTPYSGGHKVIDYDFTLEVINADNLL